ncbi:MAG: hypothetical protein IPP43_04300 [Chitinophagaceae bacterium]|nr:hypothetical protein [Chitinophagaceae bacterium]
MLIGIFFFKDKVKSQKIVGVVIGFLGLVLLTVLPLLLSKKSMSFDNLGYTLLIVLATFLYGINVNMVGHYLKRAQPDTGGNGISFFYDHTRRYYSVSTGLLRP